MSLHDEFQKLTGFMSVATSDVKGFFAPFLAELKSLEDHVLALGAQAGVVKPDVVVTQPIAPAAAVTDTTSSTSANESGSTQPADATTPATTEQVSA